jgi:hypothetical protein
MRAPDQVITRRGDGTHTPYMLRWFLFRSKRFDWMPRLYLHKFLRSDDDRAPHDHPWWFISILLKGSYIEHRWIDGIEQSHCRRAPSIAFRPLSTHHRVELFVQNVADPYRPTSEELQRFKPVWTIILTGPDVRAWGFWCQNTFVPWRQFDGCGE